MRVTIIDDNTTTLAVLCSVVSKVPGVEAQGFADAKEALRQISVSPPDLIIVDYVMPDMNGIEFLRAARRFPEMSTCPIVMVTADAERKLKQDATDAGASDFLNKPVDPVDLRARVTNLLALAAARQELLMERANTSAGPEAYGCLSRLAAEFAMASGRGPDLAGAIGTIIAEEMGQSSSYCADLGKAIALRDIGMTGVPPSITDQNGTLTAEGAAAMRRHTEIGAQIIGGSSEDLMVLSRTVALHHHERWDGTGYPSAAAGADIPLSARVAAVADSFAAMIQHRPYRAAMTLEAARAEIHRAAGSHFDPDCTAAFEQGWSRIVFHLSSDRTEIAA